MNERGQLSFVDILSVASFLIALENLDANLTQNDKQDIQHDFADKADSLLKEIHGHLESQDNKIDEILKRMEAAENDR